MKKDSQSSSSLPSPAPPPPPPSSINIPNHCLILLLVLFIPGCTFFLIMTIKGGTSQACAACKYQRRRCSKECALAPYFPAEKAKEFQNAHRLFGVRNIMNILKQVPPQQKEDAMTSIIFESDMRAQYPIRGSASRNCHFQNDHDGVLIYPQYNYGSSEMPIEFLGNGMPTASMNGIYVEGDDNLVKSSMRINQHPYYCLDHPVPPNLLASPSHPAYPIPQELDVSQYDDIPFDTIADDRQSNIESKEACEKGKGNEKVEGQEIWPEWRGRVNFVEQGMIQIPGFKSQVNKLEILKDVSGIIKPSRLALEESYMFVLFLLTVFALVSGAPLWQKGQRISHNCILRKACWNVLPVGKCICTGSDMILDYLGLLVASLTATFEKIPKWWVRLYPFCPTSWSLKALLTSQFGDVEKEIVIFGERKAIDALFKSYYGYDYDDLGVAAFVLLAYVLVFAFGFHMLLVNFQKR
ncbi:hypothetical protein FNV43_RR12863 [Rhamnella rubrinervis]|uniref:LOB domain-containing protein n=1 Tax=Rhamnella rubrinervis TaxID=2594499 RepID=A0A8K0MEB8_9ROSA|nr:hypothetical protein FNV43_RR12863 [Rhamnella rubrinervis]